MAFEAMWRELLPVGRDVTTGGYHRSPFASAERECAAWFVEQATRRGLDLVVDGQGNTIAWWRPPEGHGKGLLIGSHLDSVADGGAYDGPLGVVTSYAVVDRLREEGFTPGRPIGIAVFVEEEGSRFGIACLGTRLATGQTTPARARELRDSRGVYLLDAMAQGGLEPNLGVSDLLDEVGWYVELHVEQGRDLVDRPAAVGLASVSWAHGRWRFEFTGEPNHAGATRMEDRHDPMLTYAMTALAANKQARLAGGRATFGRVAVDPNATNAIPSRVQAWLDARGRDAEAVQALVAAVERQSAERAGRDGTRVRAEAESVSPTVQFDRPLTGRMQEALGGGVPVIPTGAGHDAAILQLAGIPSAMIFVRNPTGVSHSPAEFAEMADCLAGVDALTTVVRELAR
jgi:N-carbamoyl-L-amino-acid hydrolase